MKPQRQKFKEGVPVHLPASCRSDKLTDLWMYAEPRGLTICCENSTQWVAAVSCIPWRIIEAALASRRKPKRKARRKKHAT